MKALRIVKNPYLGLAFNFIYGAGNCAIGFTVHSWWFITVGAYYLVLATTRFSVIRVKQKANGNRDEEMFAKRITGILLLVLSVCLIGVNILCALKDRGTKFHEIVMIAIATYTFTKITIAIIGLVKSKGQASPIIATLRNISFADAVVSIYTLQRSMLVSFPGMTPDEILMFNILTGTAAWIVVQILGINLIGGKYVDMVKSKIGKAVSSSYKTIERGVVEGYKKIEKGVVNGYTKIEDKFVDAYLTKDGETVEEAKVRLKGKNK